MADQPQNGDGDEQQAQPECVDGEQPRSDAAMNPSSSQQAPPNPIPNEPNRLAAQQQQLPINDFNPPMPLNGLQLNAPFNQPPQIGPYWSRYYRRRGIVRDPGPIQRKIPHFHFTFGDQDWTYNDTSQRVLVRRPTQHQLIENQAIMVPEYPPPPPVQPQRRYGINECHLLLMNRQRCLATNSPEQSPSNDLNPPVPMNGRQLNGPYNQKPRLMPALPPLVSRREVEPGIFEEVYSNIPLPSRRRTMFGVRRCICRNYMRYNHGNNDMITVIMNTPNLSQRFSMTAYRDAPFINLFRAYHGLIPQSTRVVFVAGGKRLRSYETPTSIGMKDRDNIYVFVRIKGFRPKKAPQ